ncbi:MAG TPA: hypothetical protein VMX38_20075 [Verrucomicrobiae bacterium]|nr:hypothetical protein [Verrucomicrobiae bacterium]
MGVTEGSQNQLDATRNSHLFKDAAEVVPHGVFAQVQLHGNLFVGQSFTRKADYFFFAWGEQIVISATGNLGRGRLAQRFQQEANFLGRRPDLATGNRFNALAKRIERFVTAKDSVSAVPKSFDDAITMTTIEKENHMDFRMTHANLSHNAQTRMNPISKVGMRNHDLRFCLGNGLQEPLGVKDSPHDLNTTAAALELFVQELARHCARICQNDANRRGKSARKGIHSCPFTPKGSFMLGCGIVTVRLKFNKSFLQNQFNSKSEWVVLLLP